MFYRVHYAIKNKKKVPTFQEYSIAEITEDPRIIQKEINTYQMTQSLKIVYEESEEDSIRKHTKRSEEE